MVGIVIEWRGYNPCGNATKESNTSFQQHHRYFIMHKNSTRSPRSHFREDLVTALMEWRDARDKLIICLDANEDIYKKSIGKALTDKEGLGMKEVVGEAMGKRLGATYFRGSKPIDAIWATEDVKIAGA